MPENHPDKPVYRCVSKPVVPLLVLSLIVLSCASTPAEEPEAEIKLFVAHDKVSEAKKRVQDFTKEGLKRHRIYFFDTSSLELYENARGPVILRARQKGTKEPQSTVKFRRTERDPELEQKLRGISSNWEIQTEAVVGQKGGPGISYSLDAKLGRPLSELDGAGSGRITEWFSPEQKKFLEAAGVDVDWGNLRVFGPIDADVWEWKEQDKRVEAKVTAELWPLGDRQIFELSCKKPGENLAQQIENFVAFFKDQNILAAENPQSKTKQALEHFARGTSSQP